MSTTPKFCAECGTSLQAGAKFCPQCGAKNPGVAPIAGALAESAPPPLPAAAPVPAAAAPIPAATAAAARPAAAAVAPAKAGPDGFADPVASILASSDDDGDDDTLGMPVKDEVTGRKPLPVGWIAMGGLVAVLLGITIFIRTDDERLAAFQCRFLGNKARCVTEKDRLAEIEKKEKEEENSLMGHHYGSFDLGFDPPEDTWVTIVQKRYEESRADFVKRIRDGGEDKRVNKTRKIGDYTQGKSADGQTKGLIAFVTEDDWRKKHANDPAPPPPPPTLPPPPGEPAPPPLPAAVLPTGPVTWLPTAKKKLVLPMTLQTLPLLEKEQCAPKTAEKDAVCERLTPDGIKELEKRKENPKKDEDGKPIADPTTKIRTTDVSTWLYEIELWAPHHKPRKVLFYEKPAPPDVNLKKLEAEGWTTRAFKRTPDGKFIIDNAAFDLLPEPRMVAVPKYIQLLKEIHCLRETADFKGKTEQGKKDAEDLLWEQKAFSKEKRAIAEENDKDPEFTAYRAAVFKTYQCPKLDAMQ